MKTKEVKISEIIDTSYKDYSLYTVFNRAIPSFIDGFKPSHRKAFFIMKGKAGWKKVVACSGGMIERANYHHGDGPANEMIIKLAQDFAGANNLPVFVRDGSFGSQLVPDAGKPRYIYVGYNKLMDSIYLDDDLCPPSSDIEDPEPKYYLPIVPMLLVNGAVGIAVGFATTTQPYNIKDIVDHFIDKIEGKTKEFAPLVPYFNKFKGSVRLDPETLKYVQYGTFERTGKYTIHIKEVPTCYNREQYIEFLIGLEEKGELITSFTDDSTDSWNIKVRLKYEMSDDEVIKKLKLYNILSENINVTDENERIIKFDDIYQLIDRFIDFRMSVYQQRIDTKIKNIKHDIALNEYKIKFIGCLQGVEFHKLNKEAIEKLVKSKLKGEDHQYLDVAMKMSVYNLNIDYIKKLKETIKSLLEELEYYKKITPKELYLIDLKALKGKIK